MLVLAVLSYVLVQIRVDYPEFVEHMQIWDHYSLCILYVEEGHNNHGSGNK
jgi:hypothetical protein